MQNLLSFTVSSIETTTKSFLKVLTVGVMIGLISACSQSQKKSNTNNTNDRSSSLNFTKSLSFLTSEGDTISTIQVAVADEADERNQGLMDVHTLPKNKGMLFIFDKQQELSFWMANTPLPLDIIFVNKSNEIVRIHHKTDPFTEENFKSEDPAKYAIETNAGYAIAHDIREGMKVAFQ